MAVAALGGPARAGDPASALRDALFGRPARSQAREFDAPTVARYEASSGQAFIFDRVGGHDALLKFDDDPEVWALTASTGPRGDVIYKNDTGEPVLRATRLGGLTLFTTAEPDGAAAAFLGQAFAPKRPVVLGPAAFFQLVAQASVRASRAAQHLVAFDVPDVSPASETVFAEAVMVTSQAFVHVGGRGKAGQAALGRLFGVRFLAGASPDAVAHGPTVQITVAPQLGVAGRPSSERIARAISRR